MNSPVNLIPKVCQNYLFPLAPLLKTRSLYNHADPAYKSVAPCRGQFIATLAALNKAMARTDVCVLFVNYVSFVAACKLVFWGAIVEGPICGAARTDMHELD